MHLPADQQPREVRLLDKIANYLKKKYPFGSKLLSADEKTLSEVNGIVCRSIEHFGFQ